MKAKFVSVHATAEITLDEKELAMLHYLSSFSTEGIVSHFGSKYKTDDWRLLFQSLRTETGRLMAVAEEARKSMFQEP
jgi:hypothetical protein